MKTQVNNNNDKIMKRISCCLLFILLLNCNAKFNNPTDGAGGLLTNYALGLAVNSKPSITVKVGDTEYKNGDTITINASKSRTDFPQKFQIINNTSVNLTLTGATKVAFSGTDAANFTAVQPTVTTLIPNSSSEFTINFKTEYVTDKSAKATIANDDLTAPNFSINLVGKYTGGNGSEDFVYTGSMGTERSNHTATLLSNGKVLIAGGYTGSYLSSAELYDPSIGLFTNTGSMGTTRGNHTATLLSNGKVLVVSGRQMPPVINSKADLFDPSVNLFTATGNIGTGREFHTSSLLQNGRVLVAGGQSVFSPATYTSTAELYNP